MRKLRLLTSSVVAGAAITGLAALTAPAANADVSRPVYGEIVKGDTQAAANKLCDDKGRAFVDQQRFDFFHCTIYSTNPPADLLTGYIITG